MVFLTILEALLEIYIPNRCNFYLNARKENYET
jgi:hypothetical protein